MPTQQTAKWIPNFRDPHSHVYFLASRGKLVGKIEPNPRLSQGKAPWLAFGKKDGQWVIVDRCWAKSDAEEAVESYWKKGAR